MAKKKAAKPSSSRKSGNGKTRYALDNSTSEKALEAAIQRQREIIENAEEFESIYDLDPDCLLETLLDVPNRKPLEDPGPDEVMSNNQLIRFIHDRPAQYKMFIAKMREGFSLGSAVFSCNFANPVLVKRWIGRGMQDVEDERDTFYSRLYLDIARANATKRGEVEVLVAEDKPLEWLQSGPGKYIDDEWKPKSKALGGPVNQPALEASDEPNNILKITKKVEDDDELEGEMLDKAPVEENEYEKALKVLRDSNVSPEQQPEGWMKALRIQAGEQLSEEELEVKDSDESPISLGSNEEILTEQERQAQSSLPC